MMLSSFRRVNFQCWRKRTKSFTSRSPTPRRRPTTSRHGGCASSPPASLSCCSSCTPPGFFLASFPSFTLLLQGSRNTPEGRSTIAAAAGCWGAGPALREPLTSHSSTHACCCAGPAFPPCALIGCLAVGVEISVLWLAARLWGAEISALWLAAWCEGGSAVWG